VGGLLDSFQRRSGSAPPTWRLENPVERRRRYAYALAIDDEAVVSGALPGAAAGRPKGQSRKARPIRLLTPEGKRREGRSWCLFTMADGLPGNVSPGTFPFTNRHRWLVSDGRALQREDTLDKPKGGQGAEMTGRTASRCALGAEALATPPNTTDSASGIGV